MIYFYLDNDLITPDGLFKDELFNALKITELNILKYELWINEIKSLEFATDQNVAMQNILIKTMEEK